MPWRAENMLVCHIVRDASGQPIAWVYARWTMAEAAQARLLTLDQVRRVATNIAATRLTARRVTSALYLHRAILLLLSSTTLTTVRLSPSTESQTGQTSFASC
jgi:hypothetical protein